jgi:hypothetical protein
MVFIARRCKLWRGSACCAQFLGNSYEKETGAFDDDENFRERRGNCGYYGDKADASARRAGRVRCESGTRLWRVAVLFEGIIVAWASTAIPTAR